MRNFFTLIIGVIIVVLISLSCQDLSTESQEIVKTTSLLKDASNPDIFDLYAGKNILVGDSPVEVRQVAQTGGADREREAASGDRSGDSRRF